MMALCQKLHFSSSAFQLVKNRQLNFWNYASEPQEFSQIVHTKLYGNFRDGSGTVGGLKHSGDNPYGSVFNLEFSPTEDIAVAVCSNRAIVTYDPRCTSRVRTVPYAHEDCVNCITFLDSFTFATCSDDKTIKLWDLRNLSRSTAILKGHSSWVKNIEFDRNSGILFSIAFFDGVRSWDLNKLDRYANGDAENMVLSLPDPVRMRISPDGTKMFVSLRKNICLVIDKLDSCNLQEINTSVQNLLAVPKEQRLYQELKQRETNRPSVHVMSGLRSRAGLSFRAVMSVAFHPSGDFVGLRHLDVKNERLQHELTTLYDVRSEGREYTPRCEIEGCQENYLKYIDESSPSEALDYIKEICFTRDGRILASPHAGGVRLLAVDSLCTPMDLFYDHRFHSHEKFLGISDFEEVKICTGHQSPVLTCKFANNDLLLGTGCLQGNVMFHKPQI